MANHWTREQLLAALSLYSRTAFGRMHSTNPDVVALAGRIGRTPGAVALKLVNFASLDPELAARGIAGMGNTAQADRDVWAEYYGNWEALAEAAAPELDADARQAPGGPTEVVREVKMRRGQAYFRGAVLGLYETKCCITGIAAPELLRASHIVPWAAADGAQRLDPSNGLCLNALHDAAFDRGLITLGERFELMVSPRLRGEVPGPVYEEMFARREGEPVAMPERCGPSAEGLAWHRGRVWKG